MSKLVLSTKHSMLRKYTVNLNKREGNKKIDPVIGREEEISRMTTVLLKRRKNNVLLIGDAGVGKTAIVEFLANTIEDKTCHPDLLEKTILMLDTVGIVGGTSERGKYEERITMLIEEIKEEGNVILLIDEMHTIISRNNKPSKGDGGNNIVDMLKPGLARGEISCIGLTTFEEYIKYFVKDPAFERRFQVIKIEEPDRLTNINILTKLKPIYEEYHRCEINSDVPEICVNLAYRYLFYRNFPDKAIDLLDEACSSVVIESMKSSSRQRVVTTKDIFEVVSNMTNIPSLKTNTLSESEKIIETEKFLEENIIGQDKAISTIINTLKRFVCGFDNENRPIATLLFVGPTGTGKTEMVNLLADSYYNSRTNIIRFDMSEYQEQHSISALIGPPPGYIGFDDGGILTKKIKQNPYSIVLFDEIEKAHYKVYDMLLQIMEDGRVTDSFGRTYTFKNAIIIMTSNIGYTHISSESLGFRVVGEKVCANDTTELKSQLSNTFRPEFMNRIDNIVQFNYLCKSDLRKIADIMIENCLTDILKKKKIYIELTNQTRTLIYEAGMSNSYGARPLRLAIIKHIVDPVSKLIISNNTSLPIHHI